MEKPDTEIDDLDDLYDLYTIDPEVKEEYLCYLFFSENKDTVSSFKMKEIKAFSIGLFTLIMIQSAIEVIFYIILIGSYCCISKDTFINCTLFYLISAGATYIIHLLFFVLLGIFYFTGRKAAKGFDKCDITSYYNHCRDYLIGDLFLIFVNFWLNCSGWVNKDN